MSGPPVTGSKPVTVWWRRLSKRHQWEFHHVEEGHVASDTPTPTNDVQAKTWQHSEWRKYHQWRTPTGRIVQT